MAVSRRVKIGLGIVGGIIALVVAVFAAVFISAFGGRTSLVDGRDLGGVRTVADGFVGVFVLDAGDGKVVLVDGGVDKEAKAIKAELARRKIGPEAILGILLTHGHGDHTAAALAFPNVPVMALGPDIPIAEGREAAHSPMGSLMGAHPTGVKVTRTLADTEIVQLGSLSIQVIAVPGHTAGSAVYVSSGVVFFGDSAGATKGGEVTGAPWVFSDDTAQNKSSLKKLVSTLEPLANEIHFLAFAHTDALEGFEPLRRYAATH